MIALIFVLLCSVAGTIDPRGWLRRSGALPRVSPTLVACALTLCALGHLGAIEYGALHQWGLPSWLASAPFVPLMDRGPFSGHAPLWISSAVEGLSVTETLLLGALWFSVAPGSIMAKDIRIYGACAAIMAVACSFATGGASADVYAYAGDARAGLACYSGAVSFLGTPFAVIDRFWGEPTVPCVYGPFWLSVISALCGRFDSPWTTIVALRLVSIACLLAIFPALRRLGISSRFALVLALDPAVYLQYVEDAHNDLFMVALLLWARVFAKERRFFGAVVFAAAAVASKGSFVFLTPLVFAGNAGRSRIAVLATLAAVLGVAVSFAAGGSAYAHGLAHMGHLYGDHVGDFVRPLLTVTFLLTCLAIVFVMWSGRHRWQSTWGFVSLGVTLFPWYLAWCLPYAVLDDESALPFLASIPVVSFAMSTTYVPAAGWRPFIFATLVASFFILATSAIQRFQASRTRRSVLPATYRTPG